MNFPSLVQCLCVMMGLLGKISKRVGHSLMDANNLAVVMAPNLLESKAVDVSSPHGNPLKIQTSQFICIFSSAS